MTIFSIHNDFKQFTGLKRFGIFIIILITLLIFNTVGSHLLITIFHPVEYSHMSFEKITPEYINFKNRTIPFLYIFLSFQLFLGFYLFYLCLKIIFLSKSINILKLLYSFITLLIYFFILSEQIWINFIYLFEPIIN